MDFWGVLLLITGAVVLGLTHKAIHPAASTSEWLSILVAALGGGFVSSEWLGATSTWGPQAGGLYLFPALIGALIASVAVELMIRTTTATRV